MTQTLHYLFDPLCGWCYGAGGTVARVGAMPGIVLRLLPSGLFSGEGARPMSADFAAYAWSNDQRIERLTGRRFTEQYRSQVLGAAQQMFDSGPATVALTAVALTAPRSEPEALEAIQHARYVEGRDITSLDTLTAVLKTLALDEAARRLAATDAELLAANRARITEAQALLQRFGARGVPTFLLERHGRLQLLPSGAAFSNPQAFAEQLAAA